ncbi:mycoredoxin [Myceligenerans indicum]|uniref:Mycoredoxin n=1 Tax=Myceligenerans indicum TaxID=2593663 RepID=A0ABS1LEW8_9MICO|nr:mycoredoxin [Myceligenerans indicum]MBL0884811.1 mycoredoxin [Myceligenerans indicum]
MTETTTPVPAEGTVLMYSTTWCGYCRRLRTQLDSEGIGYEVIDIEERPETASFVEQVNGGNRTVPTVVYPNGAAATNPSLADVKLALAN